jgi:hypothetical protein
MWSAERFCGNRACAIKKAKPMLSNLAGSNYPAEPYYVSEINPMHIDTPYNSHTVFPHPYYGDRRFVYHGLIRGWLARYEYI